MLITTRKIIPKIIAMLILTIMIFSDVFVIGINVISYAAEIAETNSENVKLSAYFMDENNNQNTYIKNNINNQDVKMYIEISVTNEGYFNGQISLENANFKFNGKFKGDSVKEVNENTIYLNQINEGTTAKIEVGISFIDSEKIALESLSKDTKINLTGIYKNSQKDIEIQGTTNIRIDWISNEKLEAKIGTRVLTNKVYNINGEDKRVIQILINSKLNNDLYPIQNTRIDLDVPEGVENVKVHSRETLATNGDAEFNENNYQYDSQNNLLTININNEPNEGSISWIKNEKDCIVVTYIYSKDEQLINREINIKNTITTYDNRQVDQNSKVIIDKDIDGIITGYISEDETEIYKGKLYSGEERLYTNSTVLDIDFSEIIDKIDITESPAKFYTDTEVVDADIQYVQSKINKDDFLNIFGEDGSILILDQDNNIIGNINKDTQVDESGYFNINYSTDVRGIKIETSKPLKEGILKIYHRKVINNNSYNRAQVNLLKKINQKIEYTYFTNDTEERHISESSINLKDTTSKATLNFSTDTLTTTDINKDVEIIAILESNDESKDLYKNPTVDIVFPKEITNIDVSSAKALYRNGLKVSNSRKYINEDGNIVLSVVFEGEQNKYNNEIINGLEIHFYADIEVDKLITEKDVKVGMIYTNENSVQQSYNTSTKIHIKSSYGLGFYNSIEGYNSNDEKTEVINESNLTAKLDVKKNEKVAKVTTALINNYNNNIDKQIVIIGKIPVKNEQNTFTTSLENVKTNIDDAEIYYSKDINAKENDNTWTEDISDAVAYKIVVNGISKANIFKITYDINIPENLSFNEKGYLNTGVSYNYNNKVLSASSDIILETEKVDVDETAQGTTTTTNSGLDVNVVASVGNRELKEGDSVFVGETIKYVINITNNSDEDVNDLNIKAIQENGNIYDLVQKYMYNPSIYTDNNGYGWENFYEETDTDTKDFGKINIEKGAKLSLEYQTVVTESETLETYGNITISNNDDINENITTIKNKVVRGEIKLEFESTISPDFDLQADGVQQYNLNIENISGIDLQNIEVQIVLSKELFCEKDGGYIDADDNTEFDIISNERDSEGETVITLNILKLSAGQTSTLFLKPYMLPFDEGEKYMEMYGIAILDKENEYTSNVINRKLIPGLSRSDIDITQMVKVNNIDANQDTVVKRGDEVEFYVTIYNRNNKKDNITVNLYLPSRLKNIKILMNSDDQITDITDKLMDSNIKLTHDINENAKLYFKIKGIYDNSRNINLNTITNKVSVIDNLYDFSIYSSEISVNVEKADDNNLNLTVNQVANPVDKSVVKNGDKVEFTLNVENICEYDRIISISDALSNSLNNIRIYINGEDVTNNHLVDGNLIINDMTIKANSKVIIKLIANIYENGEDKILNTFLIKSDYPDISSNTITYYKSEEAKEEDNNTNNNQNSNQNNDNNNDDNDSKNEQESYNISGVAWMDVNENGKRDTEEKLISDMKVRAIDTSTGYVMEQLAITDENGAYSINLPRGKYIIFFEYDNETYYITKYHADNVDSSINCDAVSKQLEIDNQIAFYGVTDEINLTDNKMDIDIGLVNRSKFDFKLEKTISNVIVETSKKTSSYKFEDEDLAKVEIKAKYIAGAIVTVEYNIKVTNVGDVDGYVQSIIDYLPSGFEFDEDLNSDWYQKDDKLYCESLSDSIIEKGQSRELKLVLTRKMTEMNTGLVNNTATIDGLNNSLNFEDTNSDNNFGRADIIITVGTGGVLNIFLLILSFSTSIGVAIYYMKKRFLYKNF